MEKKKKWQILIPEDLYQKDFQPYTGFFNYHVQGRTVPLLLNDIQCWGVQLEVKKKDEIEQLDINALPVNTIVFSSSKKKRNVSNLMFYFRCLPCHPDNIQMDSVNGIECYQIQCNKKKYAMKGLVACKVWPSFMKSLTEKIRENENN